MTNTDRPAAIVFDVNGTLLDAGALEPLFRRVFGDGGVLRLWYSEALLYSQSITLAGAYLPFATIGGAVLRMLGAARGVAVGEAEVEELRASMLALPAFPDVAGALGRLREAGYRLATLTNSAPDPEGDPLARAGIADLFERQFSVDAARRFKPAPETYRMAAEGLGVLVGSICLVAAHPWDTLGARAAGCRAALVARPGYAPLPPAGLPRPEIEAADLGAIADRIIGLWG